MLGNVCNTDHKSLRTAIICQPYVSTFLGNFFLRPKLPFLPKYITNTYFTLKFFIIFDKTIFHRK